MIAIACLLPAYGVLAQDNSAERSAVTVPYTTNRANTDGSEAIFAGPTFELIHESATHLPSNGEAAKRVMQCTASCIETELMQSLEYIQGQANEQHIKRINNAIETSRLVFDRIGALVLTDQATR